MRNVTDRSCRFKTVFVVIVLLFAAKDLLDGWSSQLLPTWRVRVSTGHSATTPTTIPAKQEATNLDASNKNSSKVVPEKTVSFSTSSSSSPTAKPSNATTTDSQNTTTSTPTKAPKPKPKGYNS